MSADEHAVIPPLDEEEYFEANAAAQAKEPRFGDWGFFSYLDRPACCGGGIGGFAWFDDESALYAFIRDYFAWAPVMLEGITERNGSFGPRVQALFDDESLINDKPRLMHAFNDILKGDFQIRWWGPFTGLLEGADEFPLEVRQCFWKEHEQAGDQERGDPIPADDLPQFVDFIRYYGI